MSLKEQWHTGARSWRPSRAAPDPALFESGTDREPVLTVAGRSPRPASGVFEPHGSPQTPRPAGGPLPSPGGATDHHIYSLRWSTTRRCRRFRQCCQKTVVPASSHVSATPAGSARRERPTLRRTVCSTDPASLTERLQHRCQGSMRADHQPASSPPGSRTGDRRAQIESLNGHPWRGRRA